MIGTELGDLRRTHYSTELNDLESEAKIELIDEIFQYVSTRLSRE